MGVPDGQKRSAVSIVADNVQFIEPRAGGAGEGGHAQKRSDVGPGDFPAQTDLDDDIPF